MTQYSKKFKNRKIFGFSLEGEKDPLTNKSEADLLEEIARVLSSTTSKITRDAVLEYLIKKQHLYSKNPILDQFVGESKPEDYVPMEPTLADYLPKHIEFMRKSITSKDEARRREQQCMSLQREYYLLGESLEEKEIEEARQSTIKREQQFKSQELGIGIEE